MCATLGRRRVRLTVESDLCLRLDQGLQLDLIACQILEEIVDQRKLWEKVIQGSWVVR
jgi:hypothetical protein